MLASLEGSPVADTPADELLLLMKVSALAALTAIAAKRISKREILLCMTWAHERYRRVG